MILSGMIRHYQLIKNLLIYRLFKVDGSCLITQGSGLMAHGQGGTLAQARRAPGPQGRAGFFIEP